MIDELRNKRELSSARKDSVEFAYVQLLFDALIAGGASVPSDVVWPYIRNRIPECLILLARSGVAEGKLLSLLDSDLDDSEWLLVNELLLGMHSGRFLAHMVEGAQPEHIFGIADPPDGWELQDINIIETRTPPPGQTRTVPAGFPPVGVYELFAFTEYVPSWPGTGDVLVMPARYPIYYRRIVVPTGGSVQWGALQGPCGSPMVLPRVTGGGKRHVCAGVVPGLHVCTLDWPRRAHRQNSRPIADSRSRYSKTG